MIRLLTSLTRKAPALLIAAFFVFVAVPSLLAQEAIFRLDPATAKVEFTLSATMHTVHGTFKLKSGVIRFDPATGKASGAVIVDAASGDTDNSSRDKKMHSDILESAKFAEIVFTPAQVSGMPGLKSVSEGSFPPGTQTQVAGVFRLHGQDHPMTLSFSLQPGGGGSVAASTQFVVPYIQWGLKSPNTFLLHVGDAVTVNVHATARLDPAAAESPR